MKNSLLLLRALLVFICTAGLLAYNHPSIILYCARPITEGPGSCSIGMDDSQTVSLPHYLYLATGAECSLPCSDSTAIRSIGFKPFK